MTDNNSKSIKQNTKIRTKQKLYCYVDESGQDTKGKLFVVGLVVTGSERDELEKKLLDLERSSGKQNKKWQKSRKKERLAYINAIIESHKFKGKLFYSYFDKVGVNYYYYIIFSLVKLFVGNPKFKNIQVVITIDALEKSKRKIIATELRSYGIKTNLIRGKKDESSALLRLADSTAGLVRDGIEKHPDYIKIFDKIIKEDIINILN